MVDVVKIKDSDNLYRDIESKALISTDHGAISKYRKQVEAELKRRDEFEAMKTKVDNMEGLLLQILKKLEKK